MTQGEAMSGGTAAAYRPIGKIDEGNWQAFADGLRQAVDRGVAAQAPVLRVDLADVPYMSSRGLRALTLARKAADGRIEIVLAGANPRLREILAISRYDQIFRIVD